MAKKKPAKPAKTGKKTTTASRKPERSQGELSSDDLESVAGGIVTPTMVASFEGIKKIEKIAPTTVTNLPSFKSLVE
jgi:hypothetical protein